MAVIDFRQLLTALPMFSKHRKRLLAHQADSRLPQLNINLNFEDTKIDEGLPHLDSEPRNCGVCNTTKPAWKFPSHITVKCQHEIAVCKSCMEQWIDSSLKRAGWETLTCPQCASPLEAQDVAYCASEETYQRYEQLTYRARMNKIPNFFFCLGPNCTHGDIHDPDIAGPKFSCDCGFTSCVKHGCAWHENKTCSEHDHDLHVSQQELDSIATIEKTTKKCPSCGTNIEKSDGCDHMTCAICSQSFCWLCLGPFGAFNVLTADDCEHRPGCIYELNGNVELARGITCGHPWRRPWWRRMWCF